MARSQIPRMLYPATALPDWLTRLTRRVSLPEATADASVRPGFPDQRWLITFERPDGAAETRQVLIPGGGIRADLERTARIALHRQHDIGGVTILRITLDMRPDAPLLSMLDRITAGYSARIRATSRTT